MQERRRPGYAGSGPGEFTPDGCAVDLYLRLPVGDETRIIAKLGDGVSRVVSSEDVGDGVREVHVEYAFPDATWTQTFRSRPLTVARFEAALRAAGLFVERYLVPDGTWVAASPII